jgi:hypothetical protein
LVEHNFGRREFLTGRPYFPVGYLTRPRIKIRTDLELVEFLADRHAGVLQDVLRITATRHQGVNISENPTLVFHHQLNQLRRNLFGGGSTVICLQVISHRTNKTNR